MKNGKPLKVTDNDGKEVFEFPEIKKLSDKKLSKIVKKPVKYTINFKSLYIK